MKGSAARAIRAGILLALTSCNGLLGIEDRQPRPDAAANTLPDGVAPEPDAGAGEGAAPSAYASAVMADAPLLYLRFGEQGGSIAHDQMHRFDGTYPSFGATFSVPGALAGDPDGA